MKFVAILDSERYVLRVLCTEEDHPEGERAEDCAVLTEWAGWPKEPHAGARLRVAPGETVARWFDPRSLEQQRAECWEVIKAERAVRLADTFEAIGHAFQVDQVNLPGAALDAFLAQQLGEAYAQAWVLADNSVLVLDAAQLIAVARACAAFVKSLWATSTELRAAIEAAPDAAALAEIRWPAP